MGSAVQIEEFEIFIDNLEALQQLSEMGKARIRLLMYLMPINMVMYMIRNDPGFLGWALMDKLLKYKG